MKTFLPIPKLTEKQLSLFWSRVDKTSNCWEWTGYCLKDGYGRINISNVAYMAHRVSYAIANGDPGELCVCHSCDNCKCVNPKHLWRGTHQENMEDRDQKNRQARGVTQGPSELSEAQVIEILASGTSHQDLADRYRVSRANISFIKRGKTWKHIKGVRVQNTTRARKDSTVGVNGVSPHRGKYKARIQIDGKRRYLGVFHTIEEATEVVREARKARDDNT